MCTGTEMNTCSHMRIPQMTSLKCLKGGSGLCLQANPSEHSVLMWFFRLQVYWLCLLLASPQHPGDKCKVWAASRGASCPHWSLAFFSSPPGQVELLVTLNMSETPFVHEELLWCWKQLCPQQAVPAACPWLRIRCSHPISELATALLCLSFLSVSWLDVTWLVLVGAPCVCCKWLIFKT